MSDLVIRNARSPAGRRCAVTLAGGRIAAIGPDRAQGGVEVDAGGALVLPGLHDHHLHILATAARRQSVDLAGLRDGDAVAAALRGAPVHGGWVRAVNYDERAAGLPDRALLDRWLPDTPLRVQDRTGALWAINSAGLALIGPPWPDGAERAGDGLPNGRLWRADAWLARALPAAAPDLAPLGAAMAALGLTGLTDAGASNDAATAATLDAAHRAGALPQRLLLMGGEGLAHGPLKLLIDERDPPDIDALAARIGRARDRGRVVAAHCVTEGELALFLAALAAAGGARPGDRIEHGGMIPAAALPVIAAARLTVVTNPGFLHDRGDRYRATIAAEAWPDLYRAASLIDAGIALAAGSDAPYASVDPWLGMRAARDRRTATGAPLSPAERLSARAALRLYHGRADAPGGLPRRVAVGEPADLMLCDGRLADLLADLDGARVRATIVAGRVVFSRGAAASPRR